VGTWGVLLKMLNEAGVPVPQIVAELSPCLSAWKKRKLTFREIDAVPFVAGTEFPVGDSGYHRAVVVPIARPSLPNGHKRMPFGFAHGRKGEIELIRAGWHQAAELDYK
jgi:hypothetical protein